MLHKPDSALVIVGHGSTLNPDSSAPSLDHAAELTRRGIFGEVHCAFWKEEPSFRQIFHSIERDDIYVVPNFISEGYFTKTVIPRELELDGPLTHRGGRVVKYCEPVGNNPRMTELLLHRAAQAAPNVDPKEATLFIVGHGTDLNENSAAAAKREVDAILALERFADVRNAYMEEEPLISKWDEYSSTPHVIVVPFFISDGLHSYEDIPMLLGITAESLGAISQNAGEVFRHNPYSLRGRQLYYASAVGTEPLFADIILEQVARFDAAEAERDGVEPNGRVLAAH